MKLSFYKRIIVSIMTAAVIMIGSSGISAGAAPDEYHDDWLHVNENAEIVDMYGNPVWITGCN